jgi:cell division protein FtsZ
MQSADSEANIIFGAGIDERMGDEVRITVIATGFEKTPFPPKEPPKKPFEKIRSTGSYETRPTYSPYASRTAAPAPAPVHEPAEGEQAPAKSEQPFEPEIPGFVNSGRPTAPSPAPQVQQPMQQPYQPNYGQPYGGQQPAYPPYQPQQQPYYPPAQNPYGMNAYPPAPQQPAQAEKDELGVPAFLRRAPKK